MSNDRTSQATGSLFGELPDDPAPLNPDDAELLRNFPGDVAAWLEVRAKHAERHHAEGLAVPLGEAGAPVPAVEKVGLSADLVHNGSPFPAIGSGSRW